LLIDFVGCCCCCCWWWWWQDAGGQRSFVTIGTVSSVERNNEVVAKATVGQEVAVKIEQGVDQQHIMCVSRVCVCVCVACPLQDARAPVIVALSLRRLQSARAQSM
jgi:hypothetical protein